MHPTLAKIIEHIKTKHGDHAEDLDGVIRDCAESGFTPVFIIAGLIVVFQIPHGEAKRRVASHFFHGNTRTELERFHSELEATLSNDRTD